MLALRLMILAIAGSTEEEEPVKRLPDAIVFGIRKAGTRAILEFLRVHPQVVAAKRELHFFDRRENYYK